MEVIDYYGNPINVGDIVSFPNGAGFMDGVVESIKINERFPLNSKVFVKNTTGYKKWKDASSLINRTFVEQEI
jgi:hypothetical protein